MDCSLPGFSVCGIFQARVQEWVAISFSRDLPDPGIEPGSPALQADTLLSEPPGKPSVQAYFFHSFWKICTEMNVTLRDRDPVIENKCLDIKEGRRMWQKFLEHHFAQ